MPFRHLDYPESYRVDKLGAAAIDALLDQGDLETWRALVDAVRDDPFGDLADTILRICSAHPMYGTSALWTTWIEQVRARAPRPLAEIRRSRGLAQTQVARLLGSTQSDVSKLERRSDVRVSTLASYAAALGGELEVRVKFPGRSPIAIRRPERPG